MKIAYFVTPPDESAKSKWVKFKDPPRSLDNRPLCWCREVVEQDAFYLPAIPAPTITTLPIGLVGFAGKYGGLWTLSFLMKLSYSSEIYFAVIRLA